MEIRSFRRMRILVTQMAPLRPVRYRERTRADIHDGQEYNTLQSEAGYIDARPLTASLSKPLATHGRTIHKGQSLPNWTIRAMSAFPLILLQKSFCTRCQKFRGPLMRFSCRDRRDLITSR